MANLNLSNGSLYELVQEQKVEEKVEVQPMEQIMPNKNVVDEPVPTKGMAVKQEAVTVVKVNNKSKKFFDRSLGGFLLFVAIVVVLALCLYFTIYRLGWGVSECMNKNYHNCGVLLTPEVAPLALTGLAALI
jgi:hypothetical protein